MAVHLEMWSKSGRICAVCDSIFCSNVAFTSTTCTMVMIVIVLVDLRLNTREFSGAKLLWTIEYVTERLSKQPDPSDLHGCQDRDEMIFWRKLFCFMLVYCFECGNIGTLCCQRGFVLLALCLCKKYTYVHICLGRGTAPCCYNIYGYSTPYL